MSAARPAPAATRAKRRRGAARSTTRRCRTATRAPCSATSTSASFTHARRHLDASSAATAASSSRPTGPDGKPADYEIDYTFGVYPLQQYLIAFPDGRLQALGLAWDTRPKEQGGQRWFHLYPDEKIAARRRAALDRHRSELELHVRRLPLDQPPQRNYDRSRDSYAHHLVGDRRRAARPATARARRMSPGPSRRRRAPTATRASTVALRRSRPDATGRRSRRPASPRRMPPSHDRGRDRDLRACAMRAARQLADGLTTGPPLLDAYRAALLDPGLYQADGQMRGRGLQLRLVPAEPDVPRRA